MPVEFVRDASGRRTRSGNLSSAPALVPDVAPKAGKVVAPAKPTLWSMLGNAAAYEAKRFTHDPLKRLTELGASAVRRPINDIKYEAGQLSNLRTVAPRLATYGMNALPGMAVPASRDSGQATATIMANTARNAIEAWQSVSGKKNPDYSTTGFGQFVDFVEKSTYNRFGDKPPIEQEGLQRLTTDVRNDIALALGIFATGGALGAGLKGAPVLGRVAAGVGNALNPLSAKTAIGGIARAAAGGAVEESLAVPFQDNSGSAAGLVDLALGTSIDPVKPGMNRVQQMQAAVGPNALAGALVPAMLGGAFQGITRGRRVAAEVADHVDARSAMEGMGLTETHPETGAVRFTDAAQQEPPPATYAEAEAAYRAKNGLDPVAPAAAPAPEAAAAPEQAAAPAAQVPTEDPFGVQAPTGRKVIGRPDSYSPVQDALLAKESAANPDTARYQEWLQSNETQAGVPSAQMEPGGSVTEAKLPEADPNADPWDVYYDESLPEADVVLHQLRQMDPEELKALDQSPDIPIAQGIENALLGRPQLEVDSNRVWDMVSMPRDNVAEDFLLKRYTTRVGELDFSELRDLAFNSPQVADRLTEITGKGLDEATKTDLVKTVLSMDDVLLTNRMKGGSMAPLQELAVVPEEMQYKGNVNAIGEQAGNPLEGVTKWDPDAEGVVSIYPDSAAGVEKIVNGHHRYGLAERLGVPSLLVKRLDAASAPDARFQGAVENISAGAGTVWDAAKFVRESGITDLKQLKDSGKSITKGLWKDGFSLSKLPDDLFLAAQNGVVDERYAALIGGSGLSPEKMTSLFQEISSRPPTDAGEMTNLILAAKSAPTGSADQVDLFGNASVDLTREKARLARDIQKGLSSEKGFFGRIKRNAGAIEGKTGSSIDAAGAASVADQAKIAKRYFDSVWFQSGPVSDLLDRGAADIANGMSEMAVSDRIKQQLPALLEQEMGKTGPVAVGQASLLDEVAPAPEPTPPPEPSLDELHGRLLQRAIAKGEVRPPETIIPDIPVDNGVNLQKALEEAARGEEGPNLQAAIAEEARLREEFRIRDEAVQQAALQARRDAEGYDLKTFEERKPEVMADIIDPEVMPRESRTPIADRFGELMRQMAESDARTFRTIGEFTSELRQQIDELAGVDAPVAAAGKKAALPPANSLAGKQKAKEIADLAERIRFTEDERLPSALKRNNGETADLGQPSLVDQLQTALRNWKRQYEELTGTPYAKQEPVFTFPADLSKSAPRYGMATVQFGSDLDRAAYMLRDGAKKSKGEDRLISALEAGGYDVAAIRAHGNKVKQAIKQAAGGGAAPQKAMKLSIPDQGFGATAAPAPAVPPQATGSISEPAGVARAKAAGLPTSAVRSAFTPALLKAAANRLVDLKIARNLDDAMARANGAGVLTDTGALLKLFSGDDMELKGAQGQLLRMGSATWNNEIDQPPVAKLRAAMEAIYPPAPAPIGKPPGVSSREYLKDLSIRSLPEIASAVTQETLPRIRAAETPDLIRWANDVEPALEASHPELTRVVREEVANRYADVEKRMQDWEDDMKRGQC
jgi:hypothetical protein